MSAQGAQTANKERQARWQWWLPYLGGIAGFLALLGSLLTFTVSKSIDIYRQTTYKEKITVVSYESRTNGVFLNSGDGELFLSHMRIQCPELKYDVVDPLNGVVKPKEFLQISRQAPPGSPVNDIDDEEWNNILALLRKGFDSYTKDEKNFTITWAFLFRDDVALKLYKNNLSGLRTLQASGELSYFSPYTDKEVVQAVPLVGIVYIEQSAPNNTPKLDNTPKPDNTSNPSPQ